MYLTHHQKPPGSPLWAQPLQHTARFRYRTLFGAFCLSTIAILWIFGSHRALSFGSRDGRLARHEGWRTNATQLIPPNIWQIVLPKKTPRTAEDLLVDPEKLQNAASWLATNPGYSYTVMGERSGLDFVRQHFPNDQRIVDAYVNMPNVGMKSDFLRYLLLGLEGGVYTDTDTIALKPVDQWIPERFRDRVRLIIGIEFDRRDGSAWFDILHWVQFCQWTIAAAPGHIVFRKMAGRILQSLDALAAFHEVPIKDVKPTSTEVMNSTGPAAWTEVIFEQLQEYDHTLTDLKNLSYISEPKLIGDILILPVDGFGMGQPHSNATKGDPPETALMKHLFYGSWRGD